MKLRLMINMINISVKNSQNVATFRVVNLTGVMKKPNTAILKQNILGVHQLAGEIIIMVFTWHD